MEDEGNNINIMLLHWHVCNFMALNQLKIFTFLEKQYKVELSQIFKAKRDHHNHLI